MKKLASIIVFIISVASYNSFAFGAPLDLTSFTADAGATSAGGIVTFNENSSAAIYFYNDFFHVANDVTALSFDYSFLGDSDLSDYLVFDLNFANQLTVSTNGTGNFSIDLTSYRGSDISLAWGLIWGGGSGVDTMASISNIDLARSVSSVPEPATIMLLLTGFVGLFFAKKELNEFNFL